MVSDEEDEKFDIPNIIEGSVEIRNSSQNYDTFKTDLDTRGSRMKNKAARK